MHILVGNNQILTVYMGTNITIDITIPCGGRNPPYTYTSSKSSIVAENVNEHYSAIGQTQSNNGEIYCCMATGGTTCYQLNITCVLSNIHIKYATCWL